jgi:hypothetical protein
MEIEFDTIEPRNQAVIDEWLGLTSFRVDRRNAAGTPRGQVIQIKNRLRRREHPLPSPVSVNPKADKPKDFASSLLESARNLWHLGDEARH